jgi:hypothetical protein
MSCSGISPEKKVWSNGALFVSASSDEQTSPRSHYPTVVFLSCGDGGIVAARAAQRAFKKSPVLVALRLRRGDVVRVDVHYTSCRESHKGDRLFRHLAAEMGIIMAVGMWLPFSPLGPALCLTLLSALYWPLVSLTLLCYALLTQLVKTCLLYLPASFHERERVDVSTLFPSKLADYTAVGLPVLVWGPAYSSAARWAADNPGATELVTGPGPAALQPALQRLSDPVHAARVATAGVAAGARDFDPLAVRSRFWGALSRVSSPASRQEAATVG